MATIRVRTFCCSNPLTARGDWHVTSQGWREAQRVMLLVRETRITLGARYFCSYLLLVSFLGWQTAWLPSGGKPVSSRWFWCGAEPAQQGSGSEISHARRWRTVVPVPPEKARASESQAFHIKAISYWNQVSSFESTLIETSSANLKFPFLCRMWFTTSHKMTGTFSLLKMLWVQLRDACYIST